VLVAVPSWDRQSAFKYHDVRNRSIVINVRLRASARPPTDPVSTHRWAVPPIFLPLRNHDNTRGSEHAVVQSVALLRNCSHTTRRNMLGPFSLRRERRVVGLHRADRLVRIGVERLMKRINSGHTVPLKHTQQARVGHLHPVEKRAGIGLSLAAGSIQPVLCRVVTCLCTVQVVHLHRYVAPATACVRRITAQGVTHGMVSDLLRLVNPWRMLD
jgi:hypothetical protein